MQLRGYASDIVYQSKDLALWCNCFLRTMYLNAQCDTEFCNSCYVLYFYSQIDFRKLLTVTPTERRNNVKNEGAKQGGVSPWFESVQKE